MGHSALGILAQSSSSGGSDSGGLLIMVVWLVLLVLAIAGFWKVFEKAGEPGWAAIVPLYNIYVLCKIAGRPWWFLILYFIPFVNFIVAIVVSVDVAKSFGKGVLYGVGLAFLPFICYPILGFSSAQYQGPAAGG